MTDWLAALIPNANGLPLVDKELPPACSQWERLDLSTLFSNCRKVNVSLYVILTLSKGLLPSRADALRGWLTWLRLIGVGVPRGALSFKGAWIAEELNKHNHSKYSTLKSKGQFSNITLCQRIDVYVSLLKAMGFIFPMFWLNTEAIPNSLTILIRDGRGIRRFFSALFAALGSLIIPKKRKRNSQKRIWR